MTASNTARSYGSVSKTLHWITALGILTLLPLGQIATWLPHDTAEQLARKALVFSVHKTLGVMVFMAALARILWAMTQVKPAALHPDRKLEHFAAETVHWLLYGSLVLVPLSGWIHHAATEGFAPIWVFGQNLFFVPENQALSDLMGTLHGIFAKVLAASLLLHIAGALKHHVIDRDDTLRRMLPGKTHAGIAAVHPRQSLPVLGAVSIWAGAIVLGLVLHQPHGQAPQAAQLAQVQSDWQVQNGTLGLTIQQFGAPVTGQFDDWTAQISFDADTAAEVKGHVEVEVAIGSLQLGTVSAQAMGADYFNVDTFPTARFSADIFAVEQGYEARGTLQIKALTLPLTLPFTLDLQGDSAQMSGGVDLDRRSYEIGQNMTDPKQLGFGVTIAVDLTAKK
jgi:cytochrome b561/polyisoprenoid-binding protein YceI